MTISRGLPKAGYKRRPRRTSDAKKPSPGDFGRSLTRRGIVAAQARLLAKALAAQSADASEAKKFLANNPLVETPEEAEFLLKEAMRYTAKILDRPEIWSAIELVAEECIKNDGKLSKAQIEGLLAKALPK